MNRTISKYLTVISLSLISVSTLMAQSYERMWTEVKTAVQKDHPQTALDAVNHIYRKAQTENNDGQLMRAMLTARLLHAEVSPDSGKVATKRLEAALAAETSPAMRALWQSALGQILINDADTANVSRGKTLLLASVADITMLGKASAKDYLPVLIKGKDSQIYHDDLLSVLLPPVMQSRHIPLSERQRIAGNAITEYQSRDMRKAALLVTLDSIDISAGQALASESNSQFETLLRLKNIYADTELNVETYIRLIKSHDYRNYSQATDSIKLALAHEGVKKYGHLKRADVLREYIARCEQPMLRFYISRQTLYPGRETPLALTARNVKQAEVRFYRLNLKADDNRLLRSGQWKNVKKWPKTLSYTLHHTFKPAKASEEHTDSLQFHLSQPGIYLCELLADNRHTDHNIIYVSSVTPLMLNTGEGLSRIVLVDAMSGQPLPDSRIVQYEIRDNVRRQLKVYEAGPDNEIIIPLPKRHSSNNFFAVSGNDAYSPDMRMNAAYRFHPTDKQPQMNIRLFTDRTIYRPGQTVRFGGIAYTQHGDETTATAKLKTTVGLFDTNGRQIDTLICVTDEFGAIGGEFKLPSACLPGNFYLHIEKQTPLYFKVEEYKRPTFTVETESPQTAYAIGDTIHVTGKVKTYSGLPLAGTAIKYRIDRWMLYRYATDDYTPQTGTAVTDEKGHFSLPVVLTYNNATNQAHKPAFNRLRYAVSIDATAENGETVSAERVIAAATKASWIETYWSESLCKENLPDISIRHTGSAGQALPGTVSYTVYANGQPVAEGHLTANAPFVPTFLRNLPSGEYDVTLAIAGTDSLQRHFLLFSETDRKPSGKAPFWHYERTNAQADSTLVIVGSPHDSIVLFYDLYSGTKRLESRRITFSDSLLHFHLAYRSEMGDGARACFAFVKNGELYSLSQEITKPVPQKKLRLEWSTFRSLLRPGQQEEWRLRVFNADGSPARASLMARLYDASLDALAKSDWNFRLNFPRNVAYVFRSIPFNTSLSMWGMKPIRNFSCPEYQFTHWDNQLLDAYPHFMYKKESSQLMTSAYATAPTERNMSAKTLQLRSMAKGISCTEEKADDTQDGISGSINDEGGAEAIIPRSNFAETAYFAPRLITDENGEVTLSFTLPESLTSWNFTALAHNGGMDHGRLDTTVVARKEFMLQPAMPRFVRQGDRVVIPVTLRNLTDHGFGGTTNLQLLDAQTDRPVKALRKNFELSPGATQTLHFELDAEFDEPVLICRITATGGGFSDGEEHYLPVLSSRVEVIRSIPFSQTEAGRQSWQIDTLWTDKKLADNRRLTVEMSANPTWYAVAALPAMADNAAASSPGWASRYYAVTLAQHIAATHPEIRGMAGRDNSKWADILSRNPELKQTLLAETPWAAEAQTEAERTAALATLFDPQTIAANKFKALDNLKSLQQPDGSWSWYNGMPGNSYVTADVAILLARLRKMTADQDASALLDHALRYLEKSIRYEVKSMKELEKRDKKKLSPTEAQLRYLYLRSLLGLTPDNDASYLLSRAELIPKDYTMYGKALTAVTLAQAGHKAAAATFLKSLKEHTVEKPGMGRYFDTDRAQWSWQSYRIPTQTATIEALMAIAPDDVKTIEQMRLWLMQTKRTQMWATGRATADAIYALLMPVSTDTHTLSLATGEIPSFTLSKGKSVAATSRAEGVEATETAGYISRTYTEKKVLDATTLTVSKENNGLTWGNITARYTLPAEAVKKTSAGLSLSVRYEVLRGSTWQAITTGTTLHSGNRLRQVFTVEADRDYDFVCLKASRAACLSPVKPLSGYTFTGSLHGYRAVHDATTDIYFEQMRKGRHTVTEEYFIDRAGNYLCAPSQVSCHYAPEFGAQTERNTLKVN